MNSSLPEQLLSQLSERVAEDMGLHFPRERWRELEAGVHGVARELGMADPVACMHRLIAAPLNRNQIELLAAELTIGETYFFREPRSFAILGEEILPELIHNRRKHGRRLRIWSAGCCTGEEPYSIAILLERILPDLRDWQITLLATDVNARFLRKAEEGVFGEWSFRDAPPWLKSTYFHPLAGKRFAILPRLRRMVTFTYLNLAEDAYPSLSSDTNAMDLILCRNVLMYFPQERAATVVSKFHRALVESGWLAVGAADGSSQLLADYTARVFDGAVLYRKRPEVPEPATRDKFESRPWYAEPSIELEAAVKLVEMPAVAEQNIEPTTAQTSPYQEALEHFEMGCHREAAQQLDAWLLREAPTAQATALRARICANLGELAEARRWAELAIGLDRISAPLHYLLALILQEQGVTGEARAALKRALYLEPDFVLAHFSLGNLARRQGNVLESCRHFSNALDLLRDYQDDAVLPHAEGMAVSCLRQSIQSLLPSAASA